MRLSSAFLHLCGLISLSLQAAAFAHSPQTVNRKLLERQGQPKNLLFVRFTIQDSPPSGPVAATNATEEFPAQWFTQPLDHFSQGSPTFKQRFWVNKRHYVPGSNGPVIVIDGGETSGEDRLPFLDTGIAEILANATGGIGIVLEHRYVCPESFSWISLFIPLPHSYYGQSIPSLWCLRAFCAHQESRRFDTCRQPDNRFPSVNKLGCVTKCEPTLT